MCCSACTSTANWFDADEERLLIEQAKRDRQAFARLYRRHYAAIAGYLYRRTGDVHATEDLTADVFLSVLRSLPRYRHRDVPFRSFLYRVATNAANRWARRQRRRHQPLEEQAAPAGHTPADRAEAPELARQILLGLPPRYQAVLALHYLEGLAVEEVAAVLGCRAGTVKSRLFRARGLLRARLEKRR
ncbi:MAG: RNA polymerase sigma factor [Phycisphaerae bacterium]|jgi:RNA polymerase sigma-70 factor (ECF subfamily)